MLSASRKIPFLKFLLGVAVLVFLASPIGAAAQDRHLPQSPEEERLLQNIRRSAELANQGRYSEAIDLARSTYQAARRLLGDDHAGTVTSKSILATNLSLSGRFAEADRHLVGAIEESRKIFGDKSLITLNTLLFLGRNRQAMGRYAQAEQNFREVAAIGRGLGANTNPMIGGIISEALGSLSDLLRVTRRLDEAEAMALRVIELRGRAFGQRSPKTLASLNGLALILLAKGQGEKAASILEGAHAGFKRSDGLNAKTTLQVAGNLAHVYSELGRLEQAETILQRIVGRYTQEGGARVPDSMTARNNLAIIYMRQGKLEAARHLNIALLEDRKKFLGASHPDTLTSFQNLAANYVKEGDISNATAILRQSVRHASMWVEVEYDRLANRAAGTQTERARIDAEQLTFGIAAEFPGAETAEVAAYAVLNGKGQIAEREAVLQRLIRQSSSPEIARLSKSYLDARRDLAGAFRLALGGGADENSTTDFRETETRIEKLEAELRSLARDRDETQLVGAVEVEDVKSRLAPGTTLIEYTYFSPFDFKTMKASEDWHYAAVVLRDDKDPVFVDLGSTSRVDPFAVRLVESLQQSDHLATDTANNLYALLLAPLTRHIAQSDTLIIVPAGTLGFVPFELLGHSLNSRPFDEFGPLIRVTSTGRALITSRAQVRRQGLLALGDVDYGPADRASVPTGALGNFARLEATGPEVEEIARIWEETQTNAAVRLEKNAATEANLVTQPPPRVLHLATHGFAFADSDDTISNRPSLYSGIALAGANSGDGRPSADDGVLFGYEIEQMDLSGTELVVISACNTGIGRADAFDGIYSLARAFRLAGAEAVLVTLRPVDDEIAAEIMGEFYKQWLRNPGTSGIAGALARTKQMRLDGPLEHWAPFVLIENVF